jgi:hypothetical protein
MREFLFFSNFLPVILSEAKDLYDPRGPSLRFTQDDNLIVAAMPRCE